MKKNNIIKAALLLSFVTLSGCNSFESKSDPVIHSKVMYSCTGVGVKSMDGKWECVEL